MKTRFSGFEELKFAILDNTVKSFIIKIPQMEENRFGKFLCERYILIKEYKSQTIRVCHHFQRKDPGFEGSQLIKKKGGDNYEDKNY